MFFLTVTSKTRHEEDKESMVEEMDNNFLELNKFEKHQH